MLRRTDATRPVSASASAASASATNADLPLLVRVVAAVGLAAYFIVGFHVAAWLGAHRPQHTLRTRLDDLIPFVPWTVYLYSWVYTSAFYPLFVVRAPQLFRRTLVAYAIVFTAAFACFVLYPVTAVGLRPDPAVLDVATFHGWGLRLTYAVDPPANLFPSLHLAVAAIAALSAARASRALGLAAAPIVAGIAVSICTTRQHFVLDGVAGLALALVVDRAVLGRGRIPADEAPEPRSHGARGATLYLAFHCLVYLALYIAFRAGVQP